MAYTYDVNSAKKDKSSGVCLFACGKISKIINLFLSTFLVAHIYSFSGDIYQYIFNVGIYEITTYATLVIVFLIIIRFVEKSNRVWYYRLAIVLRTALVVFAIFFGNDMAKLIYVAGFLNGFSNAFYYASYNVMQQEMVSRKSIKSFIVFSQMFSKIISVVVPVVLGALIEISTFTQVAIYILVICLIQVGISLGIKSKRPENSNFNLKEYFKKIKPKSAFSKKIKFLYLTCFVYGATTIVEILVNICVMMQFGSSFKLGIVISVLAFVSVVVIFVFNRFTKAGNRSLIYMILAVLPLMFTFVFAISPGVVTLICYNAAIAISSIVFQSMYDAYRNSTLKEEGFYDCIPEHQTVFEICLGISRVVSYGLLLILNLTQNLAVFKTFMCLMAISYSAMLILLLAYEKIFLSRQIEALSEKKTDKIIMKCLKV